MDRTRPRPAFIAPAPHNHKGWAIYETCYVARLNDDDHLMLFPSKAKARAALGKAPFPSDDRKKKHNGHP